MPSGGKRPGAGQPVNLDATMSRLVRQIDRLEARPQEAEKIDLTLYAIRLNIQVNRLLALAGIERPTPLTDAEREEAHQWAEAAAAEDDEN